VQPADWRIYLTPLLVLASAVIAYLAMLTTRRVARQRATLDLVEKVESGEHYRNVVQTFTELRRGKGFAHLNNPKTEEDKKARRCIFDFLNHYEMVSIGIRKGILDEAFYRDWMRGPFVRDWNAIALFVQKERWKREDGIWKYYDQTFIEFELLARAWSDEAIQLSRLMSGPPPDEEADAPSAEPLPPPRESDTAGSQEEIAGPPQRALGVNEVLKAQDGSPDQA
jgi:hypothetical protein